MANGNGEFSGIYSFSNRQSLAVGQIVWKQSEKYPLIFTAIVIYGKLKNKTNLTDMIVDVTSWFGD